MSKPIETREREWQFAASGLEAVREWIARQPQEFSARRFAARSTLELVDTYYDSRDWKIFSAGFALRMRQSREADGDERRELTLKALRASRDGFADRIEITEATDANDLTGFLAHDTPLGERIRALVGPRVLDPLFSAHTRRERQQLLEADSELPLAEIDLDHTLLRAPSGAGLELTRVEVECLNADPAVVQPMVEQLRSAARLEPANESKFRAGLGTAGLHPSGAWTPPSRPISASAPFASTALTVLARYFADMLQAEPRARLGSADAVHEMRVAARHLDVLIKVFVRHLPAWVAKTRNAVRELIKTLGAVRDCDVQLAYLAENSARDAKAAVAPLRTRLEADRRVAHHRLLDLLDSDATRAWWAAWQREFDAGPRLSGIAHPALTCDVARDLIRAQSRKLRKRADALGADSSNEDYHEVRIRAKRLRYLIGAFAVLYGAAAAEYERALARLQDVLGAQHDAAVRAARFASLAQDALPADTSFALGRLVERDAQSAERLATEFSGAYRRIRRRRWRALQAAMKAAASTS